MFSTKVAVVCLLYVIVAVSCDDPPRAVWPEKYYINGMIHYPDTELKEFFDMWYDGTRNASRIDFYGGNVKYYQLGNGNGVQYKIVPVTTEEVVNERTCFQIDGTPQNPIGPQAMFPNMDELEYKGLKVNQMGKTDECYQTEKEIMGTTHKYTMWVYRDAKNNPIPRYYELVGHNTLFPVPPEPLDVIDIAYFNYTELTDIPADKFDISKEGLKCKHYPGPASHKVHAFNPVADIIHPQKTEHVEARFKEFVNTHGKQYESDDEHSFRKMLFRRNVRYIEAVNRQNKSYKLGVNHLADRTDEEMQVLRGRIPSDEVDNEGLPFPYENPEDIKVPDEHDWRLYGAVTPMKDQAHCSSSWAFGVIAALEGAYFLKTGESKILSEQAVMDCAWGFGNNGCHGGTPKGAYQWIKKHNGVPATDEYGKYLGENANCRADLSNNTKYAAISGWVNVTSNNEQAMKVALFKHGPVEVSVDASPRSFFFYSGGIYEEENCGSTVKDLGHSLTAVGYGTLNGHDYWLLKNTWYYYWGVNGYMLVSRKGNVCGVLTAPTYPVLK